AHDWNNGTTNGCNPAGTPACSLNFANMAQMLTQAGVTWHWYSGQTNFLSGNIWDVLPEFAYFKGNPSILQQNTAPTSQFLLDITSGTLPSVSWIIPGKW